MIQDVMKSSCKVLVELPVFSYSMRSSIHSKSGKRSSFHILRLASDLDVIIGKLVERPQNDAHKEIDQRPAAVLLISLLTSNIRALKSLTSKLVSVNFWVFCFAFEFCGSECFFGIWGLDIISETRPEQGRKKYHEPKLLINAGQRVEMLICRLGHWWHSTSWLAF